MVDDATRYHGVRVQPLDPIADRDAVMGVFAACADYVQLETGEMPGAANVAAFFEDVAPGLTLKEALKLGILDQDRRMIGLIDIARGYPRPGDWYIGLLMINPAYRNGGLGRDALKWVLGAAGEAGADRLLLCVLEENRRGRAFWEREGFVLKQTTPPWTAGKKTHIRFELERPVGLPV